MKRMIALAIWAFIQLVLVIILFLVPIYSTLISVILVIASLVLSLAILVDDSKLSTSKLTWIVLILALPVIGVYLYLLFGQGYMVAYKKKVLEDSRMKYDISNNYSVDIAELTNKQLSIVKYLNNMKYYSSSLHYLNDIQTYNFGRELFDEMIADFKNAQDYIHIEFFIMKSGVLFNQISDVLIKKAQEGVEIRMLCDYVGSSFLNKEDIQKLRNHNIRFELFNKLKLNVMSKISNFRDHRKIVVIDGKIAYTGGFNIADEYIDLNQYYGHWQDFHIRLSNSAAVLEYQTFFAQNWYFETKENLFMDKYYPNYQLSSIKSNSYIFPFVDGPDTQETYIRDIFVKCIMSAQKSIMIATPYFIPDAVLLDSLLIQANSGIDITIITPGLPDKKYVKLVSESYYKELLKAGIKIVEYQGFVHSKKMLIDDEYAIIGTANFDMRSFNLSFEACSFVIGNTVINKIKESFEFEISNGVVINIDDVLKEKYLIRISKTVLRLFAPLF